LSHFDETFTKNFVVSANIRTFAMLTNRLYKKMRHVNYFKRLSLFLMTLAVMLMSGLSLYADEGKLYTADEMSSSSITCVTQDSYGFIWVGTGYGLNRFDGYQFAKYFTSSHDSTSIVSNEVTTFLVDAQQQLWIGCRKGLVRYVYESDSFQRYAFPDAEEPRVTCMLEDSEGTIYIGTSGYGLYVIPKGANHIVRPRHIAGSTMVDFVGDLFEDDQHQLWCSSLTTAISRYDTTSPDSLDYQTFDTGSCGPVVSFVKQDQRGFFVVCMYGILFYDYQTAQLSAAGYDLSALRKGVSIREAIFDQGGQLYIGTSGMGLMMVPAGSNHLQQVENVSASFDLSTANVDKVFEDRRHNLWLSCNKKGLYQLSRSHSSFVSWRFSTQNCKLGSSVSSIAPGLNDDVLCVVQKSGIYRFKADGKVDRQLRSPEAPVSLFRDRHDHYWLGTENALYAYDPSKETSQLRLHTDGWGIACISDDTDDHLFLGIDGKGLCIYNTATGESEHFSMSDEPTANGRLVNDWIRALYYDSRGLLWIGTVSGLGCMDPHHANFNVQGWDVQFKGKQCYSLYETLDGNMLIGTEAGIYLFDRQSGKFSHFPGAEEMQNKSIYSIVTDRMGDLWMSTANGIWHYNTQTAAFDSYVYGDGLEVHEYVVGARITLADGRIMFGNNDGVTVFHPQEVKEGGIQLGDVFLTSFSVGGKHMDMRNRTFDLPHTDNSFVMEFSLLDFRKADNTTFYYSINGNEWTAIPEGTHVISFNKVKSGTYDIEVRAMSNGSHSASTCQLRVVVHPPFYLTWWAIVCYVLLAVALVVGVLYYLDHQRKKKFDEDKMKLLINATHDIRSPLTLIMSPLQKLRHRELDDDAKTYLDVIDRNAQRILTLVNQILDIRKIDRQQMHLHCKKTDLNEFIGVICKVFEYNARERNITFSFCQPAEPVEAWIDRTQFDKVLSNLLSNAFKYTFDRGDVVVVLKKGHDDRGGVLKDYVEISVTDNGTGMREDTIQHIFDRFYQGKSSKSSHVEGTGIGLNLCKMIVDMHHGTISAQNRTDGVKGSIFTVRLPQGSAHLSEAEIDTSADQPSTLKMTSKKQPRSNYRVLIVDDDEEIGRYVSEELGSYYYFSVCNNGKDGLHELLKNPYDVVVSDVMMPEMDGFTMLRLIKTNANISHLPVIMLTSKSDVGNRLEGLEKGADAYLTKPFSMDELHLTIDNLIANHLRLKGKFSGAQQQADKVENIEVKGNDEQLMERVMKSVNQHLGDSEFSIDLLCEEVGISRAHLHRKMKDMTGIPVSEFIRNIRLEQAARLLREQKLNITQVAYTVGFTNQSHFSTVFRKYFGMTPREFTEKEN